MSDFLAILRVSLIPRLEQMIVDEERHLNYLTGIERFDVSGFCISSHENLRHLRVRLQQYKKYLEENEYEQQKGTRVNQHRDKDCG